MRMVTKRGDTVSRLGLGARKDAFPEGIEAAAAAGVNLFFLYHLSGGRWAEGLRALAARQRQDVVLTVGAGTRSVEGLRRSRDAYLEAIGTDYLDVFFAEYVHPDEDPDLVHGDGGVLDELARWKEQGVIRSVGATAHDRAVSLRLAEDPRLDVLMQRYNMAHRKVADEVLPACRERGVSVVAFTATRWGSLLEGHADWAHAPPSALDCYRFCAAHPAVDVVLAAPANARELAENAALLDAPTMDESQLAHWRAYGDAVYGDGRGSFETSWP